MSSRWRGVYEAAPLRPCEHPECPGDPCSPPAPGPLLPSRPRWDQVFDLIQLARTHPHLTPAEVVDKWVALREAQRG